MCLSTVTERIAKPSRKVVKAWKVFMRLLDGTLEFVHQCDEAERGRWIKARHHLLNDGPQGYISGFHAYSTRSAPRAAGRPYSDCVLPVKLRYVRTIGEQDGAKVLVADEMLIPRAKR